MSSLIEQKNKKEKKISQRKEEVLKLISDLDLKEYKERLWEAAYLSRNRIKGELQNWYS